MRNWSEMAAAWPAEETVEQRREHLRQITSGEVIDFMPPDCAAVKGLLVTAENLAAEVIRLAGRGAHAPRYVLDQEAEEHLRELAAEMERLGNPGTHLHKLLGEVDRLREELWATAERNEEPVELRPVTDLDQIQEVLNEATPGPMSIRSRADGIDVTDAQGRHIARFINGVRIPDLSLFRRARDWLQALVMEVRALRAAVVK